MSKEYVCNSCNGIIKNPHDVKMKEFYIGCSFEVDGVHPSFDKRKAKIHLCDECFLGLRKIGEKTVQEWISVKDRLPEKTGLVLGYDIGFGVLLLYYEVGSVRSGWQSVTHWMPLPQPPKGE